MGQRDYGTYRQIQITSLLAMALGGLYLYQGGIILHEAVRQHSQMVPFGLVAMLPGFLCLWAGGQTMTRMNSRRIHTLCIMLSCSLWPVLVTNLVHHVPVLRRASLFAFCALLCLVLYTLLSWRFLRDSRKRSFGKKKPWKRVLYFLYASLALFLCQSVVMDLLPQRETSDFSQPPPWRIISFFASLAMGAIVYKLSDSIGRPEEGAPSRRYGPF